MQNIIKNKKILNIVIYIIGILLIITLWEILAISQNNALFPRFHEIIISVKNILISKSTYIMILSTLFRILVSLIILITLIIVSFLSLFFFL